MKKLEKLTLKEMYREFATIGLEEAQHLNGGYSVSEMESMMAAGTWTGGNVDGMGYVGGVCTVSNCSMSYGTVSTLNRTTGSDYSDVYRDAFLSGLSGTNIVSAEAYTVASLADDVLKVSWDNATNDAVDEILRRNGMTIDSNISWSFCNNTIKIWDQCGNLIYELN